jgi:hypothetical protein
LRPWRFFSPPHFAVAGLCYAKPLYATAKLRIPLRVMRKFFEELCMKKYTQNKKNA